MKFPKPYLWEHWKEEREPTAIASMCINFDFVHNEARYYFVIEEKLPMVDSQQVIACSTKLAKVQPIISPYGDIKNANSTEGE
jgi:hypothetical protein